LGILFEQGPQLEDSYQIGKEVFVCDLRIGWPAVQPPVDVLGLEADGKLLAKWVP
jgi:hypothetical protein